MDLDLQSCARFLNSLNSHHQIPQGKQLHLLFLKRGVLNATLGIANRVLQMYSRCGEMGEARKLFDEMTERNCFSWNTLLEGYVKERGRLKELMDFFYVMPHKNEFSWNVVIMGLAKTSELDVASRLFDEMPRKNGLVLNSLIHGYVRSGCPDAGLRLFRNYLKWSTWEDGCLCLDSFVLATVIGACADLGDMDFGKQIHARVIIDRVVFDMVLGSSLVNMYAKCGDLDAASHVCNSMPDVDDFSLSALISGYANCGRMNDAKRIFMKSDPCVVLWNSLIAGHIANDELIEAFQLFDKMRKDGVAADSVTFTSILSACNSVCSFKNCQQLHSNIFKFGLINCLTVASALIDTYAKSGSPHDACCLFDELKVHDTILLNTMITVYSNCGRIEDAKWMFEIMPYKSLISWNSIIVGLSQNGRPVEALDIFCEMNRIKLSIDRFSMASVISASASISSIELGEQVFGRATIVGLDFDPIISSALIDFYCKCGLIESGRKLFDETPKYDVVAWNSMLMGYATNGYGIETLQLFHQMMFSGVLPSAITFTGIFSACDHCGLVEEAQKWFHTMEHDYHIDPDIEHYSCMVDLFARAGCLEEALNLIKQMPFTADASMLSSILRGCVSHGDWSLGKKVAGLIIKLDPDNSDAFVQLSNIFATSGDWKTSAVVRKLMKDKRLQKNPGRSWGAT